MVNDIVLNGYCCIIETDGHNNYSMGRVFVSKGHISYGMYEFASLREPVDVYGAEQIYKGTVKWCFSFSHTSYGNVYKDTERLLYLLTCKLRNNQTAFDVINKAVGGCVFDGRTLEDRA